MVGGHVASRRTPIRTEALFVNADIVYRALAVVEFASPPYAAPGGTVYAPGGQIYYPMGVSWGIRRPATFVGVDAFANLYAAPDTNAGAFLAAHAYDTRALQMRFRSGRIYAAGQEGGRIAAARRSTPCSRLLWHGGLGRGRPTVQACRLTPPRIRGFDYTPDTRWTRPDPSRRSGRDR